mgnify:CR=1 FL=1
MNKHRWAVEWKACHQADGMVRLGQAVRLVIGQAVDRSGPQRTRREMPRSSGGHDSAEAKMVAEDDGRRMPTRA